MSKLFSTCSGNKVKKQTFHKLFGFYVYSDFKQNLFRLLEVSLGKFVKTAFYEFRRTLWSKKLLRKFPILLRRLIKTFSYFSQKIYIRVVKTIFCVFRNYFEEPEFSEKNTSCLVHTRTLSIILPAFWDKSFLIVFKTASYTFRRTLWWKTILLLQSFELWSKQFFLAVDNFFVAKLSKLISTNSGEHFDKKTFLKKPSSFLRTVSNLFSDFRQIFYRQAVQTVLYVFRKHFEDADFLIVLFLVQNQILSKFFPEIRHNFFRKVVKTAFSVSTNTLTESVFF